MTEVDLEGKTLTKLAQRLLSAQEEERKRIARALHDDMGQQVASLSMMMGGLRRRLPAEDGESRQQADRLKEKLIALGESMSRLSAELYPSVLEHAGLAVALRRLCDSSGISVSYDSRGDFKDVPLQVGLGFYRVVQDTLAGLAQCSSPAEVSVFLERAGEQIELSVTDRATGLRESLCDADGGLRLSVLQQKAKSVNAGISLENLPNSDWRLTVCAAV
jgi:two-component system sensor histidine kinase UhpB